MLKDVIKEQYVYLLAQSPFGFVVFLLSPETTKTDEKGLIN